MSLLYIQIALTSLLSFLIPTQLAYHLNNYSTTVYGFVIDYLTPTIYLTDIIIFFLLVSNIKIIISFKKYFKYVLAYILIFLINVLVSSYQLPSIYKWIKITEMILLGLVIVKNKNINVFKHIIKPLSYSVLFVCFLAFLEFFNKGSIGSMFYWFGERTLRFSDPNVSPYPYSTFSHPNSLSGFLLVFGLLMIKFRKQFKSKYFWITILLTILTIILTNSLNTYLGMLFIFLVYLSNNKRSLSPLLVLFDFTARTFTHRVELITASFKLIKENILFGIGINNFIPNLPKVSNTFLNAWELQPVHNIFLLAMSEVGLIGFIPFIYLIVNSFSVFNYPLLAIIFTGISDHYWLTLQQNILLFTVVIATAFKSNTSK